MTERGDELDHSLLGRKSEGRGKEEGDVAWLYSPNKTPNKCVCVWGGGSECKRETVLWRGAAIVPFFIQGSLGRDMNNNSGNAAYKNQSDITLTFLRLFVSVSVTVFYQTKKCLI